MDFLVDMVYLWCDGSDPEFIKRKAIYAKRADDTDEIESFSDKRFFNNEELKYSLRSLEMYAPWINHVFIVTDRQIPKWLDLSNKKVTIVDHSEIMPAELIPCFNSSVIERYIGFIPGLAEKFLYANDDFFFGKPVAKSFFFAKEKPIVRLKYHNKYKAVYSEEQMKKLVRDDFFGKSIVNALSLFKSKNQLMDNLHFWELHHNIDAYTKSAYLHTYYKYKDELDKSLSRFRSAEDIQRLLFSLELLLDGQGEKRRIHFIGEDLFSLKRLQNESYFFEARCMSMLKLFLVWPTLLCINNAGMSKFGIYAEKLFLACRFPKKSSFEL